MIDSEGKIGAIRESVSHYGLILTAHADEEAREEDISIEEIHQAIEYGEIIEDYPQHRRGPCCLINSRVSNSRNIHLVITTDKVPPRVITVYEPKKPYWITPEQRRKRG